MAKRSEKRDGADPSLMNGRAQIAVSGLWDEDCDRDSIKKFDDLLRSYKHMVDDLVKRIDLALETTVEWRIERGVHDKKRTERVVDTIIEEFQRILKHKVTRKSFPAWRKV